MASYLLLNSRLRSSQLLYKTVAVRFFLGRHNTLTVPPASLRQLQRPSGMKGHLKYERYWSDKSEYLPQIVPGDTLYRALFGRLRDHVELYPLHFLGALYLVVTFLVFYATYHTPEFGSADSRKWSKIHDKYWKFHTIVYDPDDITHQRLPLMERLLDEIEEASQKRILDDKVIERTMKKYKEIAGHDTTHRV